MDHEREALTRFSLVMFCIIWDTNKAGSPGQISGIKRKAGDLVYRYIHHVSYLHTLS